MYVVTGATGNTGHLVVEKLLAAGKPVRAIGRHADKLQPLVNKGAKPIVGNLDDAAVLAKAFEGAKAVYCMIPPDYTAASFVERQNRVGMAIAGAIREMRVPYVVNLSSIGAQNATNTGPVDGMHRQEARFDAIPDLHVVHLRPAFFMENFYGFLDMIRNGFIAAPLRPDLSMPMIATRDIGEAAANLLLKLDFKGKTRRELLGQRDLSMPDVARAIGKATGKPDIKYIQAPPEDAKQGLMQAGFSAEVAGLFVEMYAAMNDGRMRPLESRNDTNTTPTSIESFAQGLAAAVG